MPPKFYGILLVIFVVLVVACGLLSDLGWIGTSYSAGILAFLILLMLSSTTEDDKEPKG